MAGEKVSIATENKAGNATGIMFGDPAKCPQGLIVLHEWWGMTQQIQTQGHYIAQAGKFTVLVLDYYRGKLATDYATARTYFDGLDYIAAVQDVRGAAKYLLGRGCNKVGVIGFSLGGALSLASAALLPDVISAAAPFYGTPRPGVVDLATIRIPVQAHFATQDHLVGFAAAEDAARLKELNGDHIELYMYEAKHSFASDDDPRYDKEAAEMAVNRTYKFMHEKLI